MIRPSLVAALLIATLATPCHADAADTTRIAPADTSTVAPAGRSVTPATRRDSSAITARPAAVADTTLGGYLRALRDSTDAYFGAVAAPPDTAGLDSARIVALANPTPWHRFGRSKLSFFPSFGFNRVDGPVLGGGARYGRPAGWGRLEGRLATATGPNLTLGRLSYERRFTREGSTWGALIMGGRRTQPMDREASDVELSALRAFLNGADRKHYLRRDGVETKVFREGRVHRLGLAYRDMLESSRVTTATWNLFHHAPLVVDNLAATTGRARELEFEVLAHVPHTPVIAQVLHATSGRALASAFEYRRTLVGLGADVGLGHAISWLPQAEYGALGGTPLPQQAFYLGGPATLRSLPGEGLGGTRIAFARSEWFYLRDVLAFTHRGNRTALPMYLGAFAATGAVWGRDPYTGVTEPGGDWPHESAWRSEAGVSLLYQPGLPHPTDFVRINVAWPLGPGDGNRVSISFGRALDLLRPFERD